MDNDISKNIEEIKKSINNPDLFQRELIINKTKITYLFIESLCSDDKIGEFILKSISNDIKLKNGKDVFNYLLNTLPSAKVKIIDNITDIKNNLENGFTVILVEKINKCIAIETKASLDRGVSTSNNENVIRGPKDSLTENYMTNLGLIRKRIKDDNFKIDEFVIGRRSKTKTSLMYIKDIANINNVEKIKRKLNKIDVDGILDTGYIRDFLIEKNRLFPTVISTERPDLVAFALLEGKIVIMVENSPIAIIMPGLFFDFFSTTEDSFQMSNNITLTKLIRYLSFFITLLTPAIFIAITLHHSNLLPSNMYQSILEQRSNLAMPIWAETIILIFIFEIIRESNVRTPNVLGSSMSIVGGLVLGDAAVSAEIASAIGVIIVAITSISGLIFSDIDMINSIRLWRIILIFLGTLFGLYGVLIGVIIFIICLMNIKVLGVSYLAPLYPLTKESLRNVFFKTPHNRLDNRDSYITHNLTRKK